MSNLVKYVATLRDTLNSKCVGMLISTNFTLYIEGDGFGDALKKVFDESVLRSAETGCEIKVYHDDDDAFTATFDAPLAQKIAARIRAAQQSKGN